MSRENQKVHALILAAGQGKRMNSAIPKVVHPVLHRPMVHYVVDQARSLKADSISLIVGHGQEKVRAACAEISGLNYFIQPEQKGTADAVKMAIPFLRGQSGIVVILSGDVVLLKNESLQSLIEAHLKSKASVTLLTAKYTNPKGYGRIIRDGQSEVIAIREDADCSESERQIKEGNCGIYVFQVEELIESLSQIGSHNKQNEFYLTDSIEYLVKKGRRAHSFCLSDYQEAEGINSRKQLSQVESILKSRINDFWMDQGVSLQNPEDITIDSLSHLGRDTFIEAGTTILRSRIENDVYIEANCRITDCKIGANAKVKQGSYLEGSEIGEKSAVGPYAHLRPGSVLHREVKVGNFVEVKKSILADGVKVSHLSYVGDAEIGKNSNLGCGFVTCNYDGREKHKTIIEENVFVGSDSQTVAPVTIGHGSYVASGSTVTENVPPDSLVLSRGKQVTKDGYMRRKRSKS